MMVQDQDPPFDPVQPLQALDHTQQNNLFKLWTQFIKDHIESVWAIIGNASSGANAETFSNFPNVEIVASNVETFWPMM